MRVVLQRVQNARIVINNEQERQIGKGLFLLVGIQEGDSLQSAEVLAKKCAELRIFEDEEGKMNFSAEDLGLDVLVVSNFTLYADVCKGRRPSFASAAKPPFANECYEAFLAACRARAYRKVECGEFGAEMQITSTADGPVTIVLDTEDLKRTK